MASPAPPRLDWSKPKTASQVFDEIHAVSINISDHLAWVTFTEREFTRARNAYPKLDLSAEARHAHLRDKIQKEFYPNRYKRRITGKEFFEIAYNWDPFGPITDNDLLNHLDSEYVDLFPLGKFVGQEMWHLMPAMGALPITESTEDDTDLEFAWAGGCAISYQEGHPSESHQTIAVRSTEDNILRHMMPLGFVVRVIDAKRQTCSKTGHILVMDMDEKRNRHPWIVLANSWGDDREGHENEEICPPQEVDAGNGKVHGVLLGTNERTPVGSFIYGRDEKNKHPQSLLLSFGPDFRFGIQRVGGYSANTRLPKGKLRGPPLATVMEWHDDVAKGELVCYNAEGKEFMRYQKSSKRYIYPAGLARPKPQTDQRISLVDRLKNNPVPDRPRPHGQGQSSRHPQAAGASGQSGRAEGRSSTKT